MTIGIGVIGCGGIGQGHIRRLMEGVPGARVTAVNDVDGALCRKIAGETGAKAYEDPHALIRATEVDAVLVASWDPTHEEFCVSAIREHKPVFCEKPLSDTSEGCKRIMEAEMAGGKRLLFVGFMRRYDAGYRELRREIAAGTLGRPLILHCKHRNMHPTGATHTTDMSVNGALVHEFDVIRYLIGEEDPYVSAQLVCPRSSRHAGEELLDPQLVFLETASGVRINLEIFMNCRYGYDIQCEVVGEEGAACLPDPAHIGLRRQGMAGYAIDPYWSDRFPVAYETELREWVHCVEAGVITGPTAWDGYAAAKVAEACMASRQENRIVAIQLGEMPAFYRKEELA